MHISGVLSQCAGVLSGLRSISLVLQFILREVLAKGGKTAFVGKVHVAQTQNDFSVTQFTHADAVLQSTLASVAVTIELVSSVTAYSHNAIGEKLTSPFKSKHIRLTGSIFRADILRPRL